MELIDNCKIFLAQFLSRLFLTDLMKLVLLWIRCEVFIAQFFSGLLRYCDRLEEAINVIVKV